MLVECVSFYVFVWLQAIAKPLQTAEVAATAVADKKLEDSAEEVSSELK